MAGGGVKGGVSVGATDEWGYKAVQDRFEMYDLHATMLHLLGIDHRKLSVRHNGRLIDWSRWSAGRLFGAFRL